MDERPTLERLQDLAALLSSGRRAGLRAPHEGVGALEVIDVVGAPSHSVALRQRDEEDDVRRDRYMTALPVPWVVLEAVQRRDVLPLEAFSDAVGQRIDLALRKLADESRSDGHLALPGNRRVRGVGRVELEARAIAAQHLERRSRSTAIHMLDQYPLPDVVARRSPLHPLEEQRVAVSNWILAAVHRVPACEARKLRGRVHRSSRRVAVN